MNVRPFRWFWAGRVVFACGRRPTSVDPVGQFGEEGSTVVGEDGLDRGSDPLHSVQDSFDEVGGALLSLVGIDAAYPRSGPNHPTS